MTFLHIFYNLPINRLPFHKKYREMIMLIIIWRKSLNFLNFRLKKLIKLIFNFINFNFLINFFLITLKIETLDLSFILIHPHQDWDFLLILNDQIIFSMLMMCVLLDYNSNLLLLYLNRLVKFNPIINILLILFMKGKFII